MWLRSLGLVSAAACAAALGQGGTTVIDHPVILADAPSFAVFQSAIRWSRENHLETGGCFHIYRIAGDRVLIVDAVERVRWRRLLEVDMDCAVTDGLWHTHWAPEGPAVVGCDMARAKDLYLLDERAALGLVVCGEGPDSLIPFSRSEVAVTQHQQLLQRDTVAAATEHHEDAAADRYRCGDEPLPSRRRPRLRCTP